MGGPAASAAAPEVSVVIPTYREAENIPQVVPHVVDALRGTGRTFEIIIVDDNSRDGTDRAVQQLAEGGLPVRLVKRTGERGLSSAVIRGFQEAAGEVLVCMDADLSHPLEAIPRLLEALADGSDFVIGSRYVPGGSTDGSWSLFRRLNSKVATLLARPFTRARDPMSGFFALPRKVYERAAPLDPVGYKIGLELIVKCGCRRVREVPIHFSERVRGESKLDLRERLRYLLHLKRLAGFKCRMLFRSHGRRRGA